MGPRFIAVFLVFSLVAVVLVATPGCPASPGSAEIERLSKGLDQLAQTVNKLSDQVVSKKDLDEVKTDVTLLKNLNPKLQAVIDSHAAMLSDQGALAMKVKVDLLSLQDRLDRAEKKLAANSDAEKENRRMLADISYPDAAGNRILAVRDQVHSSPQFRAELAQAVSEATSPAPEPRCVLRVENNMSTGQYMKVNGTLYWILPSSTRDFEVPTGTVTTELAGYEPPRYHWVGATNYLQRVVIAPRETQRPSVPL
jgi:hypothetical protein